MLYYSLSPDFYSDRINYVTYNVFSLGRKFSEDHRVKKCAFKNKAEEEIAVAAERLR